MFSQSFQVENTSLDALVAIVIRVLTCVVMPQVVVMLPRCLRLSNVDVSDRSIGVGRVVVLERDGNRAATLCLASLRHLKRQMGQRLRANCHGLSLKMSLNIGATASEGGVFDTLL